MLPFTIQGPISLGWAVAPGSLFLSRHLSLEGDRIEDLKLTDLLTIYNERSNASQIFWNYIVVVVGGIVAFRASYSRFDEYISTKIFLSFIYVLIAIPNCGGLVQIANAKIILAEMIAKSENHQIHDLTAHHKFADLVTNHQFESLAALAGTNSPALIILYHSIVLAAVFVFIWKPKTVKFHSARNPGEKASDNSEPPNA